MNLITLGIDLAKTSFSFVGMDLDKYQPTESCDCSR